MSFLDPVLHTMSSVFQHYPFLFTTVHTILLPILLSQPGLHRLHKITKHFTKMCAVTAFMNRTKGVKLMQAYFLMSIYSLPVWWWEEG